MLLDRGVRFAAALWILLTTLVAVLGNGSLPFDRPALQDRPFVLQVIFPSLGMLEIFALMGVVYWLTRNRPTIEMAARAPDRARAVRETSMLLSYAAAGQVTGWIVGSTIGHRAFSFHLAGTLVGISQPTSPLDATIWATYNFLVFALIPWLWFRTQYPAEALNLRSADRANDLLVIVVVATIESLVEFGSFPGFFRLTARQVLIGAPTAFFLYFIGTVLPTMVLIYAILLPRYTKLSGSFTMTIILGGLTYAAMHIVEGWSNFTTPRDIALSLLFVPLTYFGPGIFKSYVTLRTGNAWVHALGYHAIAPHVVVDTPLIVKVFGFR